MSCSWSRGCHGCVHTAGLPEHLHLLSAGCGQGRVSPQLLSCLHHYQVPRVVNLLVQLVIVLLGVARSSMGVPSHAQLRGMNFHLRLPRKSAGSECCVWGLSFYLELRPTLEPFTWAAFLPLVTLRFPFMVGLGSPTETMQGVLCVHYLGVWVYALGQNCEALGQGVRLRFL
jgi:hypothetical protein